MAETSNWTVPGLIGYLVSVQPTLQSSETKRLQSTPVFPKEVTTNGHRAEDGASQKVQKFKVSDLYEPLDVFRELGLPIIDWQGKDGVHQWMPGSKEGRLYIVWPLCMLTLISSQVSIQPGFETVSLNRDYPGYCCQGGITGDSCTQLLPQQLQGEVLPRLH